MTAVPMDKYLAGPQIASQQAIQEVVIATLTQALGPRDEAINSTFQNVAAKLQQLEAVIGQVALAAQQPKLSPFEVAMKAITHFGDDEPDQAAQRCRDKGIAIMERWLDAALETSETGGGEPRRAEAPAPEEEAEAGDGQAGDQPPPVGHQAAGEPAEND